MNGGWCYTWNHLMNELVDFGEMLSNWEPEMFREMRYQGYGGVDPIGTYGFHFAIVLGLVTIFGFALSLYLSLRHLLNFKSIQLISCKYV